MMKPGFEAQLSGSQICVFNHKIVAASQVAGEWILLLTVLSCWADSSRLSHERVRHHQLGMESKSQVFVPEIPLSSWVYLTCYSFRLIRL